MSDDLPAPISEADYTAIEAAVMETARGRWFLAEFARRNRNSDTQLVLDAIARLESALDVERAAMQSAPSTSIPLAPAEETTTIDIADDDEGAAPRVCPETQGERPVAGPIIASEPGAAEADVLADPGIVDPEAMLLEWTEDAVPAIVLDEPARAYPQPEDAPPQAKASAPSVPDEDLFDLDDILEPGIESAVLIQERPGVDKDDDCPRAAAGMSPAQSMVLFS